MQIVGGTYLETCREPADETLGGSGLRATAALRSVCPDLVLTSAVDVGHRQAAEVMTSGLDIAVEWAERSSPVAFDYWTPISAPTIRGPGATAPELKVDSPAALVFGMIEASASGSAERLVFDPQQPRDLGKPDIPVASGALALVANSAETRSMTGISDLREAAAALLKEAGAEVVVTKQAARGCLVTTSEGQDEVGPWPTETVWPIGSGDVFAAGFAWAWAEQRMDPVDAARIGSRLASRWCGDRNWQPRPEDFQLAEGEFSPVPGRVYLAAPFFSLAQRWLVELVREALIELGGEVFSPLHDVGLGTDEVAEADLAGLNECTAVLALLDGMDSGVLFESGWARRGEVPVVVYTEHGHSNELKMVRGTGAEMCGDLSTAIYRALWASMGLGQ